MTALVIALVSVALVSAAAYLWARRRSVREETYHLFRCGGCGQKLRYLASKAGQPGKCPRCKELCTFPERPTAVPGMVYGARVGHVAREQRVRP